LLFANFNFRDETDQGLLKVKTCFRDIYFFAQIWYKKINFDLFKPIFPIIRIRKLLAGCNQIIGEI